MTHLQKTMLEELQRRNLSKLTAESYLRAVKEFAEYYNRPPDQLGPEEIRKYQAHLFTDRKLDANTVCQHLSALRFFFIKTLKRRWTVEETPYPKRAIRLPDVLSREEVERLIDSADSPLHRVWSSRQVDWQPSRHAARCARLAARRALPLLSMLPADGHQNGFSRVEDRDHALHASIHHAARVEKASDPPRPGSPDAAVPWHRLECLSATR